MLLTVYWVGAVKEAMTGLKLTPKLQCQRCDWKKDGGAIKQCPSEVPDPGTILGTVPKRQQSINDNKIHSLRENEVH